MGRSFCLLAGGTCPQALEDHEMEREVHLALLVDSFLLLGLVLLAFLLPLWAIHERSRLFYLLLKDAPESGLIVEQFATEEQPLPANFRLERMRILYSLLEVFNGERLLGGHYFGEFEVDGQVRHLLLWYFD